jgi:DNA-binding protein HU-beta
LPRFSPYQQPNDKPGVALPKICISLCLALFMPQILRKPEIFAILADYVVYQIPPGIGGVSVNKAELAAEIAARTNNTKKSVEEILACLCEVVQEIVAKGDRVTLVGFGTFERRERQARETNNPQKPGQKIKVPAKKVPAFSAGKEFKERVAAHK